MSDARTLLAKVGGGQKKRAKGTPKRTGKRKAKIALYYSVRYAPRKLRHILKRNGWAEAKKWAEAHGALMILHELEGR